MNLRTRLGRLERTHLARSPDVLELDLPPDLWARIDATKKAGVFPHGLSDNDLMAFIHAADKARGHV